MRPGAEERNGCYSARSCVRTGERTLLRGAVAGGRRGAVNVPATSTSTTIQPVVVTLPVCLPLLLQAAVFVTAPSGSAAACAAAAAR